MKHTRRLLFLMIFSLAAAAARFQAPLVPGVAAAERQVRYVLFKAVDEDSGRSVNGAAVTINGSVFTSTSPAGLFKADVEMPEIKKHGFMEITVSRDGYGDGTASVSIADAAKIPQPVRIKMKQKMAAFYGKIRGCWYDGEGHQNDNYGGDEIKVFGKGVSTQHIMYKFNADGEGDFRILNLPLGTYELEIRRKTWEIVVDSPGEQLEREFMVRNCGRSQYHSAKKNDGGLKK